MPEKNKMTDHPDSQPSSANFFERLTAETAGDKAALLSIPLIQAALRGEISKEVYIEYLSEAFHHVRHTVPLIEEVRARIPENRPALHIVLHDYVVERQGHEKWILQDIEKAGGDPEAAKNRTPSAATRALVDYAYDFVLQENPIGYFGMAYVVEGTGSGLATNTVDKLMDRLGLPKKCFSYMLSHGNTDLEQMDSFETLMAQITDPEEQHAIITMAKRLFGLYGDVFQAIADQSGFKGA